MKRGKDSSFLPLFFNTKAVNPLFAILCPHLFSWFKFHPSIADLSIREHISGNSDSKREDRFFTELPTADKAIETLVFLVA